MTQRVEKIFYIIREAAPRSSTPTESGCRISCYFEFSSLQSRVVSVWGWLSLCVFGYRSPVGVDLHRQRIKESFNIDRRMIEEMQMSTQKRLEENQAPNQKKIEEQLSAMVLAQKTAQLQQTKIVKRLAAMASE